MQKFVNDVDRNTTFRRRWRHARLSTGVVGALLCVVIVLAPSPAQADCASTVNSAVDRMMDQQMKEGIKEGGDKMTPEMKKTAEDMANQMKPKMKAAMSKSCKDDKWSGDALKCMDDAKTMEEMEKCEAMFTPDQKKNMDKAMNEAMGMSDRSCSAAVGGAVDRMVAQRKARIAATGSSMPRAMKTAIAARTAKLDGVSGQLKKVITNRCTEDKWSEDAITCYADAASMPDLGTCRAKLSTDQQAKLQAEEIQVMMSSLDGRCVSTINSAVDRMMDQQMKEGMKEGGDKMTPEMKKMAEDTANQMKPKMKAAMSKSCSDDLWSRDTLTCMDRAKTMDNMDKCELKLTADQKKNVDQAMNDAMGMGDEAASGELPKACSDYRAVIQKLASCDKMPQQARDALKNAYDEASASWEKIPPDAKASLATACKAAADAVTESATNVCGW